MRGRLIAIHRWLGLIVGLLWAVQGLTGALFVFSRDVDRITGPQPAPGPAASLDRVLDAALSANGGRPVSRLATVDAHGDMIAAYYKDASGIPRAIIVDAASAKAIGARELEPATPFTGSAARWIYRTHMALDAGRTGETLLGFSGLFLVLGVVLGVWTGWPRAGRWAAAFAPTRWRGLRMQLFGWHRALGLALGLVLGVVSLSGVYLAFPAQVRDMAARIVPFQASFSPMAMGGARSMNAMKGMLAYRHQAGMAMDGPIGPQQAVDIALQQFPSAHWVRVFTPIDSTPVYSVRLRQPGEIRGWIGATSVTMDPDTGDVLEVYDAVHAPFANRLLDALFSIHNGELGGVAGRIVVLVCGLSLPVLYITGVWAWLHRRRQERARRRPANDEAAKPGPRPVPVS
jgi:uncharacterized iron-regulated membrane protein